MRRAGRTTCLFLLLCPVGCNGESIGPEARKELDTARKAYQQDDDVQTLRHANAVLRIQPKGEAAMQAYYLRGLALARKKEHAAAQADLERVCEKTRNVDLRVKAADALGELAFLQGDLKTAIRRLKEVLDLTPDDERPADHAHFRLGCIDQRQGRWAEADVQFERVAYHFPDARLGRQARQRVRARAWTIQIGSYKHKNNADVAAKRFRDEGFRTHVEPVLRDGELVFLLQIGRWGQYEDAEAKLPSVRRFTSDAFLHVAR